MDAATVCLLAPPHLIPPGPLDRFVSAHPELTVHWIDYGEPNDLRMARVRRDVTPEHQALEPTISAADQAVLADAVAVVALDLPTAFAELAPKVRFVQAVGAGIEWLIAHRLDQRGIVVTNARGIAAVSIAEFVIGRLLEVVKRTRAIEAQQRAHEWKPRWGGELDGRTLGIVGLGAIGRETATRARAFGMHIVATRRSVQAGDTDPDVDELWPLAELDEMLGRCDAVLLAAPATPETRDLFDAGRFAAMADGAIFVNIARGSLVDEPALVDALESGHLGAAVIDVAKQEPAPPDHPFWTAPNLYLSPHCSSSMTSYADRLFDLFGENLRRYQRGEELVNIVDHEAGY